MSRRRKQEAHANHERWLVSYADFITLLFAFFVVLYSSAQVDHRKVGRLALAIQVAFQELGVFSANSNGVPIPSDEPVPSNATQLLENSPRVAALGHIVPKPGAVTVGAENGNLGALEGELRRALAPEIERKDVVLRKDADGLVISLREVGFFDSGSAHLRTTSLSAFERMAGILHEQPYLLRIEGHTDDVPIHTAQFASNWELSTSRATEIVRRLIARDQFAPGRLAAAGYAEFHPVASNDSEEGRGMNRRVDIVILRRIAGAEVVPH